jgi:exonuclease III
MKKILVCVMVLFLAFAAAVFADSFAIEQAFQAYEAVVVEAENIARRPSISLGDFSAIDEKADIADMRIQAVANQIDLSLRDTKRLAILNTRFSDAILTMALKLGERGYSLYEGIR